MAFFECSVRNLVFPVRRCSELEFWRGPAAATLQFSRTALHRSGKSACFSSFGGVRFATFGQSPCSRCGPGLGSAPRATPVSDVSIGISVRRCALLGERSALMPMLTSGGAQNSSSGGVRRVQLSSFRERRSIEVENRLRSRVLGGFGSVSYTHLTLPTISDV